jgi:PiT family inorganic phosphate transporter
MKVLIPNKHLYEAPEGDHAAAVLDPLPARLTCTGVSFAHGSNDGQKGMGLIMLILIGTVPTAYALNRAVSPRSRGAGLRRRLGAGVRGARALRDASVGGQARRAAQESPSYVRTRKARARHVPALRAR